MRVFLWRSSVLISNLDGWLQNKLVESENKVSANFNVFQRKLKDVQAVLAESKKVIEQQDSVAKNILCESLSKLLSWNLNNSNEVLGFHVVHGSFVSLLPPEAELRTVKGWSRASRAVQKLRRLVDNFMTEVKLQNRVREVQGLFEDYKNAQSLLDKRKQKLREAESLASKLRSELDGLLFKSNTFNFHDLKKVCDDAKAEVQSCQEDFHAHFSRVHSAVGLMHGRVSSISLKYLEDPLLAFGEDLRLEIVRILELAEEELARKQSSDAGRLAMDVAKVRPFFKLFQKRYAKALASEKDAIRALHRSKEYREFTLLQKRVVDLTEQVHNSEKIVESVRSLIRANSPSLIFSELKSEVYDLGGRLSE